ncbi:MAG: putative 4-hydroxybenzoate polyprenyltransferase [Verrucomicrobiae bacterium]|nr:putative 4-hydroxybenzoate polyprenyltransferase [Verrucomicrobiae bacterium]
MVRPVREARKWADFVKIPHTVFALPFALAAMILAARDQRGWPGWRTFLLIVAAMFLARTCAMTFNRIVDRRFDAENPRTALRHLPTGEVSLFSAWLLWTLSAVGFVVVTWFINGVCFALSPVALVVVCFYSLTKRFTDFTHVFLGVALALAPIGAWVAVKGSFHLLPVVDGRPVMGQSAILPLLLAVAVVFWLAGFDIIYALQDYEFDRHRKLGSLVVRWGVGNALRASALAHLIMVVTLGVFGLLAGFKVAYLLGLLAIFLCLAFEHWLARKRDLKWINTAFFRLNAVISLIFLLVILIEVALPWFRLKPA